MSSSEEQHVELFSDREIMSRMGYSLLESIPPFSGAEHENASAFIGKLQEAFAVLNVKNDKIKLYFLRSKLRGLPLQWLETIKYTLWGEVKNEFVQQFHKVAVRPKDVMMRLMTIKQDPESDESVQSLSIRLKQLFNDYEQVMGKPLAEADRVEYLVESLFPSLKEQLRNQYQSERLTYDDCTFDEVLRTALKLERNARAYEDELHSFSGAFGKLKINAVHKTTNPAASVGDMQAVASRAKNDQETLKLATQNAEDIRKIQKEQLIIKDQLQAVSNALSNFGADMRSLRESVERLRYERKDCPGTVNPMYNHRFRGSTATYQQKYSDPRFYNPQRSNDGGLQDKCFKCGEVGHYANACRSRQHIQTLKDELQQKYRHHHHQQQQQQYQVKRQNEQPLDN